MKEIVTVLTPTYNRADYLKNLFLSLQNQTNKSFIWMIVDDGSIDDTTQVVNSFIEVADFTIEYYKKENGGKHTALNLGFSHIQTYFTFIVDSDDILTADAIESIIIQMDYVKSNDLCGICFLRGYNEKEHTGKDFPVDFFIANDIDIRLRRKIIGDKSEVWRTDILQQYSFPVFEGENYQGENYVWWQIARRYNMLYINKIIYITCYLDDGLTKAGRRLRIRNPLGGMENCKQCFFSEFPFKTRIKYAIIYDAYGLFANWRPNRIINSSTDSLLCAITMPLGILLYWIWKGKYLE